MLLGLQTERKVQRLLDTSPEYISFQVLFAQMTTSKSDSLLFEKSRRTPGADTCFQHPSIASKFLSKRKYRTRLSGNHWLQSTSSSTKAWCVCVYLCVCVCACVFSIDIVNAQEAACSYSKRSVFTSVGCEPTRSVKNGTSKKLSDVDFGNARFASLKAKS